MTSTPWTNWPGHSLRLRTVNPQRAGGGCLVPTQHTPQRRQRRRPAGHAGCRLRRGRPVFRSDCDRPARRSLASAQGNTAAVNAFRVELHLYRAGAPIANLPIGLSRRAACSFARIILLTRIASEGLATGYYAATSGLCVARGLNGTLDYHDRTVVVLGGGMGCKRGLNSGD